MKCAKISQHVVWLIPPIVHEHIVLAVRAQFVEVQRVEFVLLHARALGRRLKEKFQNFYNFSSLIFVVQKFIRVSSMQNYSVAS